MHSRSPKQVRTMATHNPRFAKKMGIAATVGKDLNQADKAQNNLPQWAASVSKTALKKGYTNE